MSNRVWSRVLSAEERDEVTAAVFDAYKGPNGERGHSEAGAYFLDAVRDAQQAHRSWAELLWTDWAESGAHAFARRLWSERDTFTATVGKQKRKRRASRGVQRVGSDGHAQWHQPSILELIPSELDAAIEEEVERVAHGRFNVRWMKQLRGLIESTGATTGAEALSAAGFESLEKFLEADSA